VDQDEEDEDIVDIRDDNPKGAPDLVLSEIETRVATNNARLHAQMIKANNG
jgi:hypothetical protein